MFKQYNVCSKYDVEKLLLGRMGVWEITLPTLHPGSRNKQQKLLKLYKIARKFVCMEACNLMKKKEK